MNLEKHLKSIEIALKIANWFSIDEHIDYGVDFSSGNLFVNGSITFFNETILDFTESVSPEKLKYRYQYMTADSSLIFRYDNVPHFRDMSTFPHHKHLPDRVVASQPVTLRQVIEEIVDLLTPS